MSDPLELSDVALRRGHFALQNGRHSDQRFDLIGLLQDGSAVEAIGQMLAEMSRTTVGEMGSDIDLVVNATPSSAVFANIIGRSLGVHSVEAKDGMSAMTPPRARVLVVADDVDAAGQIQVLLPSLYAAGGHPIAAAVVVRRSSEITSIEAEGRDPIPLIAGITLNVPTYEPADCPLCAAGEPIGAPGSIGP